MRGEEAWPHSGPLFSPGPPSAANSLGHQQAGHQEVPGQLPGHPGRVARLREQLQLRPGVRHLPGGVLRGPGEARLWFAPVPRLEREAGEAGVGVQSASVSCVSCVDNPEVGSFSWFSREREFLFVECVPHAKLCSGCSRGIVCHPHDSEGWGWISFLASFYTRKLFRNLPKVICSGKCQDSLDTKARTCSVVLGGL